MELTLIAVEEERQSAPSAGEMHLLCFDNEFAVPRPDPRGNPVVATNALLKAVYTAWFDDLNRLLVRRQIGGRVADLAHVAGALAVLDVSSMLGAHANPRYGAQFPDDSQLGQRQLAMRLGKLVPALNLQCLANGIAGIAPLLNSERAVIRSEYLWTELYEGRGRNFDLSAYMYFAQPVLKQLEAVLPKAQKPEAADWTLAASV